MQENSEQLVSLFVVHWNRPLECIATVNAFVAQEITRIVVVDNDSTPDAFQRLRTGLNVEIQIIRLPQNKGWGPALNVALQKWLEMERNPFCLISAHDAAPNPDCVEMLVVAAQQDERVGIACPQYPDETVPRFSALHGVSQDVSHALSRGTSQSIDVPHGTLMLVRRDCLSEIGLFDERYFAYGDEHELGARAVRKGWKVVLVWGAVVTNPDTSTPSPLRSYLFTRNSLLLVHDYFGRLKAFMRALVILANTLKLSLATSDRGSAFSARTQIRGIWDYVRGRYGPPRFEIE